MVALYSRLFVGAAALCQVNVALSPSRHVAFLAVGNETGAPNKTVSGVSLNKTEDDVKGNWHEDLGKGLHPDHNVNSTGYNYNGTTKHEVTGHVGNQTDKDPEDFGNIYGVNESKDHFNWGKGAYRSLLAVHNETGAPNKTVNGVSLNKTEDDIKGNWHEDLGKGLHPDHNVNSTGYNYNGTTKHEVTGHVGNQTDKDPEDFGNIYGVNESKDHFNWGKGAYRSLLAVHNETGAPNRTVNGVSLNKTEDDIKGNWHEDLGKGLHPDHNVNSTGYNYNGTTKHEVTGHVGNQTDKDPEDFGNIYGKNESKDHFNWGNGAYRSK